MELFKTLFRHFRSFGFISFLNISGLALALAVFLVIVIQLRFEWGYDKSYRNSDRIFRVEPLFPTSLQYSARSPVPLGELLKINVAEIEDYFVLADWGEPIAQLKRGDKWGDKFAVECRVASASMIDMLEMEILEGDGRQALTEPRMLMVPESLARQWFPEESPVGKQMRLGGGKEYEYTIGAVYRDLPQNSVFTNVCYASSHFPQDDWSQWDGQLFVLARTDQTEHLQKVLEELPVEPLKAIYEGLHKDEQRQKEGKSYLKVVPLPEIYYDNQAIYDTLDKGNKSHVYLMLGVGLLVIFIALVNFINFTLSLAPSRMKSVNTRKVLGASVAQLKRYFVAEALLYVGIAWLCALFILQLAGGWGGSVFLSAPLEISKNWSSVLVVGIGILIVGGIVGYYPASYITSFEPAMVLKGSFVHTPRGIIFRNGLSVFQFAVSITLIICTILMIKQNRFTQEYAVGYTTENIGWTKLDLGFAKNSNAVIEEIRQLPGLVDYTFSDYIPGGEIIGGTGNVLDEVTVQFDTWYVYPNFLRFFSIPLLRGDSISEYNRNQPQLLLNEKALKLFPVLENYEGKTLSGLSFRETDMLFKGVTQDFHYLSLHKSVGALAIICDPARPMSVLFFKLAPGNQIRVIEQIREIFDRLAPESLFEFHFLDDTLQQGYLYERQLTGLISFMGGLAVFLALVGIYGMIVFQTQYRRKEIAIRKVNGATESDIWMQLNRGMLYQWLTGVVLACPLAYYLIELWLRSFSYHTTVRVWMFVVAAGIVLSVLLLTVTWQSLKAARANPVKELVKE